MDNKKMDRSDIRDWIVIVILFAIGFTWPIGAIFLFRKLMGYSTRAKNTQNGRNASDYHAQYEYHYTGTDLKARHKKNAANEGNGAALRADIKRGKAMGVGGGIMAALFSITGISKLLEYHSWGGLHYAWSELFLYFGLCVAGLVVLYAGLTRTRKGKRFQKYLSAIGRQKQIAVTTLASATGHSARRVCDDLDEMLEKGFFPIGYLDRSNGILYLTDEGVREPVKEEPKQEEEYAILREIREVNDAIPDEVMSAKIDRVETIARKILDYRKKAPGQDAELRSFLDYYLPTTLKILRAYAQLDAQGINGENISSTKARIEGMMDKVVEGFEKQLDRLFQTEALDITSDVEVLEQMLKKDGLSSEGESFQLKL